MTEPAARLAQSLLDAHVAHIVDELSGPGFRRLVDEEIEAALGYAGKLKLGEVVSRAQIKATAVTWASELEIAAGIPELVGEIARALHAHEIHDGTTPADLVSDRLVGEWLDQILGIESLREAFIREALTSPLYQEFAADLLYQGISGYLEQSQSAAVRNIPGAASVLKLGRAALSKAPGLESSIEDGLRRYISRAVQASARSSADFLIRRASKQLLTEIGLNAWERLRTLKIGALRRHVGSRELEEGFVLGYETWRELRGTEFYRVMITAGVDAFFDRYEKATLAALLEDLGIGPEQMRAEAMRYAPPIIKLLKKKKLLDAIVRRRLAGFYESAACRALLAGG